MQGKRRWRLRAVAQWDGGVKAGQKSEFITVNTRDAGKQRLHECKCVCAHSATGGPLPNEQ